MNWCYPDKIIQNHHKIIQKQQLWILHKFFCPEADHLFQYQNKFIKCHIGKTLKSELVYLGFLGVQGGSSALESL